MQGVFDYTPNYCEENIYRLLVPLAESISFSLTELTVLFISNALRMIPLWSQKLQRDYAVPVIWDYHVILHYPGKIYDFDSTLAFPCDVTEYIEKTFHPEVALKAEFQRMYRLVPAEMFLENFASDRSHMLSDGEWRAPIPSWPAIQNQACLDNLQRYIDMTGNDPKFGCVLQEDQFFEFCKYIP